MARIETALHDTIADCIKKDPDVTVEEILSALLRLASAEASILREGSLAGSGRS